MNTHSVFPVSIKRIFITALILIYSFLLYQSSFRTFFFQDDWFTFRIAKAADISGFFSFFIPRTDVIYYRPMGMQVLFFMLRSIFGVNRIPFVLTIFSVHAINILLVNKFLFLVSSSRKFSLTGSFMFSASMVHFIPFHWFSTISFPMSFMFIMAALVCLETYRRKSTGNCLAGFFLFTVLSLLSSELGFMVIIYLFISFFFRRDSRVHRNAYIFSGIILILYLAFRLVYMPQFSGTYRPEIGTATLKAISIYISWLFNFPEEIANQFGNIFRGNFAFIRENNRLIFWAILSLLGFLLMFIARMRTFYRTGITAKPVFQFILLACSILYLVPFSNHMYPYYLYVSLLFFIWICRDILFPQPKDCLPGYRLLGFVFLFSWSLAGVMNTAFMDKSHWTVQRSVISESVFADIQARYPAVTSGQILYLPNDPYLKVIMGDSEAFRQYTGSDSCSTVYYGQEETVWKSAFDREEFIRERLKRNYIK